MSGMRHIASARSGVRDSFAMISEVLVQFGIFGTPTGYCRKSVQSGTVSRLGRFLQDLIDPVHVRDVPHLFRTVWSL